MKDLHSLSRFSARTLAGAHVGLVCAALCSGGCSSSRASSERLGSSRQALAGDGLVISQVYGAGGNAKAPFNEDFVELFNGSGAAVSLAGLSLQYGTANGAFGASPDDGGATTSVTVLPSASVGPGEYFLVGMSTSNAGLGSPLPTPDFVGPTDLAPQNGKIALARSLDPLGCGTATNRCSATDVADLVGYGTATDYAGTAAVPALSALLAAARDGAGCVNTGQNSADFSVVTPAPRNSATALNPCASGADAGLGDDAGDGGTVGSLDGSSVDGDDGAPADDAASSEDGGALPPDDAGASDAGENDGGEDGGAADDGGSGSDAGSSTLVISQVFGGGGNAGSPYASDFVELFNRSSEAVSLAGLAVQYADKAVVFGAPLADGGASTDVVALPSVMLSPGEYFLVALGTKGADGGAALPTPDATGNINVAAGSGKVALTTVTTPLGCGSAGARCPQTYILDMVGYGAASDYEGSGPTATLTKTTAALRNGAGCTDTRDNASDFTVAAPAPRNTASTRVVCGDLSADAGSGSGGGGDAGGNGADGGYGMDGGGVVVGTDAGITPDDSGATADDSGATSEDAGGVTLTDGGGVADDSGAPQSDDGGVAASGGSSGCSCSTLGDAGHAGHADWMSTTAAGALLLTLSRRRRKSRR